MKLACLSLVLLTLLLLLAPTGLGQKLPWHPKQGEALSGVNKVMLDTPSVRVEKWTATSGSYAEGTADHVRRTICGSMDQILEERQVVVEDYMLCLGESEASVERRQALAAAAGRFRDLANEWVGFHRTEQKLESFHLGEELEVTKKLPVDALIVVAASGILTTRGARAMSDIASISGGGGPAQSLVLHIGVIKPQTGELVFFTENAIGGDFLKHPEKLENSIEKALNEVFRRTSAPQKDSNP
jgi:hypothetical protein